MRDGFLGLPTGSPFTFVELTKSESYEISLALVLQETTHGRFGGTSNDVAGLPGDA